MTANTSTAIIASWQLPSTDSRHGIIKGFKIFFRRKGSDDRTEILFIYHASIYTAPVTGLAKFTEYEFQVLAFTSVGDGPKSSVGFAKTMEDSKRYNCLNWRILRRLQSLFRCFSFCETMKGTKEGCFIV